LGNTLNFITTSIITVNFMFGVRGPRLDIDPALDT